MSEIGHIHSGNSSGDEETIDIGYIGVTLSEGRHIESDCNTHLRIEASVKWKHQWR